MDPVDCEVPKNFESSFLRTGVKGQGYNAVCGILSTEETIKAIPKRDLVVCGSGWYLSGRRGTEGTRRIVSHVQQS